MKKVLLVEDSTEAVQLVRNALGQSLQIDSVRTIRDAANALEKTTYDLLLLDATLPDGDGFQLCSVLQAQDRWKAMPVIMLTARNKTMDKVMAFSVGADDFVCKPFDPLELRARVEAKLRRKETLDRRSDVVICNGLEIDRRTHRVHRHHDHGTEEIDLTPTEFKILLLLASEPGVVRSRDDILDAVWGENIHVYSRSVDTHVSKLRKKLGQNGSMIDSVFGKGYRVQVETRERPALKIDSDRTELQYGQVS